MPREGVEVIPGTGDNTYKYVPCGNRGPWGKTCTRPAGHGSACATDGAAWLRRSVYNGIPAE